MCTNLGFRQQKFINLCPHPIKIYSSEEENEIVYQPSGPVISIIPTKNFDKIRYLLKDSSFYEIKRKKNTITISEPELFWKLISRNDSNEHITLIVSKKVGKVLKKFHPFGEDISVAGPNPCDDCGIINKDNNSIIGTKRLFIYYDPILSKHK